MVSSAFILSVALQTGLICSTPLPGPESQSGLGVAFNVPFEDILDNGRQFLETFADRSYPGLWYAYGDNYQRNATFTTSSMHSVKIWVKDDDPSLVVETKAGNGGDGPIRWSKPENRSRGFPLHPIDVDEVRERCPLTRIVSLLQSAGIRTAWQSVTLAKEDNPSGPLEIKWTFSRQNRTGWESVSYGLDSARIDGPHFNPYPTGFGASGVDLADLALGDSHDTITSIT